MHFSLALSLHYELVLWLEMFSDWFHWSVQVVKIKLSLRQQFGKFFSWQNTTCNISGPFLLELCWWFSLCANVLLCFVLLSCFWLYSLFILPWCDCYPWMLGILWKLCCLWVFCQLAGKKWVDAVMLKFPASCWLHFVKLCCWYIDELIGQEIAEASHLWPLEVSVEQK